MAKEIIVTVDNHGKIKVETSGFSGPSCMEEAKELEEALGVIEGVTKTREYLQQPAEERNRNRLGNK